MNAAPRPFDHPSRAAALEWSRANAPDLRIQHGDGASGARFTYRGRLIELEAEGDGHHDAIVRRVFETIRERQGAPVSGAGGVAKARELEQQIVSARWRGQDAAADALERELLERRAGVAPKRPVPRVPHEGVMPQAAARTRWQW